MKAPQHRVSATTLEKFRRFMADASSYDTEAALIESLEGKFEGNDKTKTGSAFHKLIEEPEAAKTVVYDGAKYMVSENIAFPLPVAAAALQYRKAHPQAVYEVPGSKVYQTVKHAVQVTYRLDSLVGAQVRDAKTKYRNPSVTEYQESSQWKFYLDATGAKVFYYDIFEVKKFKELPAPVNGVHYLKDITVVYHEPIPCYTYLGMHDECTRLVAEFMEYIELRNFFHLLKPATENEAIIL